MLHRREERQGGKLVVGVFVNTCYSQLHTVIFCSRTLNIQCFDLTLSCLIIRSTIRCAIRLNWALQKYDFTFFKLTTKSIGTPQNRSRGKVFVGLYAPWIREMFTSTNITTDKNWHTFVPTTCKLAK